MLEIVASSRFKRDLKLAGRRSANTESLREVILALASGRPLDPKYRDHDLSGNYKGFRECHVQPDFLLIYRIQQSELFLFRAGTHADLF